MTEKLAMEIIIDILNGEANEFQMVNDPLKNGGLDTYGKEEAITRIKRSVVDR